jgi:hypothetical protein
MTGLAHYLKSEYPDDVLVYSPKYGNNAGGKFSTNLRAATWMVPEYKENYADNTVSTEFYAWDAQWLTKRTPNYGFAAKGGNNNEHHNHNDVGTFIFAKDGKQLITDMGRGAYTKQYFRNETRYEHIECSSLGHCVPYFDDDKIQKFGKEFSADNYSFEPGYFAFDMAKAYGDESVKEIKREFRTYDDYVTVTDTFVTDCAVTERLASLYEPEISDDLIKILSCEISFDNSLCDVSVKEVVTSKKFTVYLIDFKLKAGVKSFGLKLK